MKSLWKMDPKRVLYIVSQDWLSLKYVLHASKVMLKILQARLQQYMNQELPDIQAGFRKGRGTRDQAANIYWIIKKAREFHIWVIQCLFLCLSLHRMIISRYIHVAANVIISLFSWLSNTPLNIFAKQKYTYRYKNNL